jgi:hypothetical protein
MIETEKLKQIERMLGSKLIRERRAGIKMVQELLANDQCRDQLRVLLAALVMSDPIGTVKADAQSALDVDDARHISPLPRNPDDIFGTRCSKGHVSYFDKREYCGKQVTGMWRTSRRGDQDVDEVLVKCKTCGEESYVEINCEGYK